MDWLSEGQRRLAAIMFTDMVGYTALGQRNESLSLALVEEQRKVVRPILARHNGREVKTIGDAFLVEFPNAVDAVRCAYDIQRAVREFNISLPDDRKVHLRIGVHLGDVVESGGDISGDAVNVASRIEPLAEEGGVTLTRQLYEQVANKVDLAFEDMGPRTLKNVDAPVGVYKMMMPWEKEAASEITEENRIAVLPFRNMSPDPNDEYFAEGMTEEIISTVSGISGLIVISRTSVMRYKQTTKSMTEIGRELRVGKLVEGSVRKSGNRIRITVQLIDSGSDAHIWAQTYDRSMGDVFETQSDIANKIADALRLPAPKDRDHAENVDAYSLCLKARSLWNRSTREANEQAIVLFEEALKIDSGSARALAGIADCYVYAGDNDWMDQKEAYVKAREFAQRALERDSKLPEAHVALGNVIRLVEHDYRRAEVEYKKALSLNPNDPSAHQGCARVLRASGKLDEALREVKRAYELDPLSLVRLWLLLASYYWVESNDEALAVSNEIVENYPENPWAYFARAVMYGGHKGAKEEALRNLETFRRLTRQEQFGDILVKGVQARIEGHLGNKEEALRLIDECFQLFEKDQSRAALSALEQVCYACALVGDAERCFRLYDCFIDKEIIEPNMIRDPAFKAIREDPRYDAVIKRDSIRYNVP